MIDGCLRTGDMGFFHEGELFVCGRIKDMIILRGQNYYPQDIEEVVEKASALIRTNCVAAFQIHEDSEPALAIVAEVKNPKALPDALKIAAAVRNYLNVEVALISFIAPRAIPRTSSGKIMRHKTKRMWMEGQFKVLSEFSRKGRCALRVRYGKQIFFGRIESPLQPDGNGIVQPYRGGARLPGSCGVHARDQGAS